MPSVCKSLCRLLKSIDLFPTGNFLRYHGEPEYTTATGGMVSVTVLAIFVIMFANMGLKTINRSIIEATT